MSFGAWAKSNWLILVLSGVALAAAPTAYYFSSKMHKNLVKNQQAKAQKDLQEVSTYEVTYSIPSVKEPTLKDVELRAPLNKKLIDFFQARRESIKAESAKVGGVAVKFNEGEGDKLRRPLVNGVLPKYPPGDRQVRQAAMIRAYTTTAHQAMLEKAKAGMPPDPARLGQELSQSQDTQKRLLLSQAGTATLGPTEQATLNGRLLQQRLASYRRQASALSFYADIKSFLEVPTLEGAPKQPTLAQFWNWQTCAWIHQDLIDAIALANSQRSATDPEGIAGSAVKRILRIAIPVSEIGDVPDDAPPPFEGMEVVAPTSTDPVKVDPSVSITGRKNQPDNQFYDVRDCRVELIVAPHRLPALFDALARTNFMTVLKCDLEEVPIYEDLKEGFYYGDEHVVKATLQIETLWLRAWTKKYMPDSIKRALLVMEDKPAVDAEAPPPPQ